jgi:hypothetical protein
MLEQSSHRHVKLHSFNAAPRRQTCLQSGNAGFSLAQPASRLGKYATTKNGLMALPHIHYPDQLMNSDKVEPADGR